MSFELKIDVLDINLPRISTEAPVPSENSDSSGTLLTPSITRVHVIHCIARVDMSGKMLILGVADAICTSIKKDDAPDIICSHPTCDFMAIQAGHVYVWIQLHALK